MRHIPSSIVIYGKTMTFAGFGNFPYDCTARDKNPNAAIYSNTQERTWTHEFALDFKLRDKAQDHYNAALFDHSFTSAPLYKVVDNELNRKYHPALVGKYLASPVPYCLVRHV